MEDTAKSVERSDKNDAAQPSGVRTFFFTAIRVSVLVIAVATALRPLAMIWWVADLFCQFAIQYVLLLGVLFPLCLVVRSKGAAALAAVCLVINLLVISPYLYGPQNVPREMPVVSTANNQKQFRLLTQNVLATNRNAGPLIDLIHREEPDFVMLIEIDSRWIQDLDSLKRHYPFVKTSEHERGFGLGFYSKHPWNDCQIRPTGHHGLPTVTAHFEMQGGSFSIVGTHPLPPSGKQYAMSRNAQIRDVVDGLPDGPLILTGDFNLTPWSVVFRNMLVDGNLRDASRGISIAPTWHAFPGFLGGVKIDHILLRGIQQTDFRIGPDIGSDHRAVLADFVIRKSE